MNEPNTFDRSSHRYFMMIPNIIADAKLSGTALKLYLWYKRVCGENGSCYQSLKTISDGCGMSHPSVLKGRKELEGRGLILVTRSGPKGSLKVTVEIIDIWHENDDYHQKQASSKPVNDPNQATQNNLPDPLNGFSAPLKKVNPNKNPLKKNQKKKDGVRQADPSQNGNSYADDPRIFGTDIKSAEHLKGTLEKYKEDLCYIHTDILAGMICKLRLDRNIPQSRIMRYLKWYRNNYNEQHAVKMYKRDDLLRRWKQHENAMFIMEEKRGNVIEREIPDPEHNHLVCDVRRAFFDEFSPQAPAFQKDVDAILVGMGKSPGAVRGDEI